MFVNEGVLVRGIYVGGKHSESNRIIREFYQMVKSDVFQWSQWNKYKPNPKKMKKNLSKAYLVDLSAFIQFSADQ